MMTETFCVVGLANGWFKGWNLATNSVDDLQAHTSSITSLTRHGTFLISGDMNGEIMVRDQANAFNCVL